MSFQDCGFVNGRPYVPVRRHWNKWDNWLESNRDSEGTKFDPVSFRAAMEAAKERGQIVAVTQKRLCRRCDCEMPEGLNSVHCEPCANWLWDRKQRRNEIVTCTCPQCGNAFQKRLCVRQVCCGPVCMAKRKKKQRNGVEIVKPIFQHAQESSPSSSSSSA
jgi:hypothetical protein